MMLYASALYKTSGLEHLWTSLNIFLYRRRLGTCERVPGHIGAVPFKTRVHPRLPENTCDTISDMTTYHPLRQFCMPAPAAYRSNAVLDPEVRKSKHNQACMSGNYPGRALLSLQNLARSGCAEH